MKNLLLSTVALLGLSTAAQAASNVQVSQFRGLGASAGFQFASDSCQETSVYFGANKDSTKVTAGAPVTADVGFVSVYSYNSCTGQYSGGFGQGTVTIGGNAAKLTVKGSVELLDYTANTTKTALMNVTFTATNTNTYRGMSTYSFSSPYGSGHQRYNGSSSDAGVTGSIIVDGVNVIANTPSYFYGSVYTSNSGSTTFFTH